MRGIQLGFLVAALLSVAACGETSSGEGTGGNGAPNIRSINASMMRTRRSTTTSAPEPWATSQRVARTRPPVAVGHSERSSVGTPRRTCARRRSATVSRSASPTRPVFRPSARAVTA